MRGGRAGKNGRGGRAGVDGGTVVINSIGAGLALSAAGALTNTLATGLAGGQTVIGDTASGGNLTLQSTDHATRGFIKLGASSAYDEVNKRLGIGRTDPTAQLELYSTTASTRLLLNTNVSGAADADIDLIGASGNGSQAYFYFYNQVAGSEWTLGTRIVTGSLTRLELGYNGNTPSASTNFLSLSQSTVASAAGAVLDRAKWTGNTVVISGSTQIATAAGFNYHTFNAPAYSAATAGLVVDFASTVYIAGAPTATGANPPTLTNPSALRLGGLLLLDDAVNVQLNATTGTKIGTATTQKIGLWNATPVVQPTAVADAAGGAVVDAEARTALNAWLARARTIGVIAT